MNEAVLLLAECVVGLWDPRFSNIEVSCLTELERVMGAIELETDILHHEKLHLLQQEYHVDLHKPLPVDLRVVLSWNLDLVDLELHVVEPSGELCYSFRNHTSCGGMLSRDMVRGLGPEEYMIRKAVPGKYEIKVRLFASRGQTVGQDVSAQVRIYTHYGDTEKEKETISVVRLSTNRQVVHVANVFF